jgi:hypothetical protein
MEEQEWGPVEPAWLSRACLWGTGGGVLPGRRQVVITEARAKVPHRGSSFIVSMCFISILSTLIWVHVQKAFQKERDGVFQEMSYD